MIISQNLRDTLEKSSWIREMFSKGLELKKQWGAENVYDFSLGNPVFEPPEKLNQVITQLINSGEKGIHRYMPNQGLVATRKCIAEQLQKETDLLFSEKHIVMCVGAGGGLNVVLKTLLNPQDEVIIFAPYFPEYTTYIHNYQGNVRVVPCDGDFRIDWQKLEDAVSPRTAAVIINSPNNPTGIVYPKEDLLKLGEILEKAQTKYQRNIALISDEPYAKIVYDEVEVPSLFTCYKNSILVTSHSKDIAIPGERIGYIAVSPQAENGDMVVNGLVTATRILGFVNAPALMQRVIPHMAGMTVDQTPYRSNRDILYHHLIASGFSCVKPQGAFYLFPKSPIHDDVAFVKEALELKLLFVPGSGFGMPGYFRISYCFTTAMIEKSLPLFTQLAERFGLKKVERQTAY